MTQGTLPQAWTLDQFHPGDPDFVVDPYPYLARMRAEDPVHFVPATGTWWLTRHADAAFVLTDSRFVKNPEGASQMAGIPPEYARLAKMPRNMLEQDPPGHTRLRALVNKAFTPQVVRRLLPQMRSLTTSLLEEMARQGCADIVSDFAHHIPAVMLAHLLGVPGDLMNTFRLQTSRIVRGLDASQPRTVHEQGWAAAEEMVELLEGLAERRAAQPGQDLLSELLAVEEGGNQLTRDELLSTCYLLLIAGQETTSDLICNGVYTLLRNPGQLALLRMQPDLMPTAVDEMLRYEPSIQRMFRWVREDVEIGGKLIRKGERVTTAIGACNRDPAVFADPERFDITRNENPHLSFGRGTHFCIGAPLAKAEAATALSGLVERFPELRLDPERPAVWAPVSFVRRLQTLPVLL